MEKIIVELTREELEEIVNVIFENYDWEFKLDNDQKKLYEKLKKLLTKNK